MQKKSGYFFLIVAFFVAGSALSQPAITGPACVIPGAIYQYRFSGVGSNTMNVCVVGGSIVNGDRQTIGRCVQFEMATDNVLIIWNDTTIGSLSLSSVPGNSTLPVTLTSVLYGGQLDSSTVTQSFTDTTTVPSTLHCSIGLGGSCSPNYSYQWQRSDDRLVWTDIPGATSQDLGFGESAKRTAYYRRKIVETGSTTIAYSDIATITVSQNE